MPTVVTLASYAIEGQVVPCGFSQAAPLFPIVDGSPLMPFQVDANGQLFVRQVGTAPADGIATPVQPLDATSYMMLWNPTTSTWERAESIADTADGIAPGALGQINSVSKLLGFNGAGFDRLKTLSDFSGTFNPAISGLLGTVSRLQGYSSLSGGWGQLIANGDSLDNTATLSSGVLIVASRGTKFNGATWDLERTSNIFKSVTATAAGNTVVWQPAVGKKFRLMRVHISITSNAAAAVAGVLLSQLFDGAAGVIGIADSNYIPLVGALQQHQTFIFDLGNGYLSSAVNNALNINLSFALTAGVLDVTVSGTEE